MGEVNKGILFSRGFPLLTAVDGWFCISFLSRSPPGCGSRQPDFFFSVVRSKLLGRKKKVLALTHQLLIEKGDAAAYRRTQRQKKPEIELFIPPPPPFFLTDSRLRNRPIYLTNHHSAERYGRLTAISNRFLDFFLFFSFLFASSTQISLFTLASLFYFYFFCYDLTSPRNSFKLFKLI